MAVGRGILQVPRAVAGDDDVGDPSAPAGAAIALVVNDVNRVVALGPEGGIRNLADGAPKRGIAGGDEVLVLGVRAPGAAGVDAVALAAG